MKEKIVVENTLTPYIEHLRSLGYDVYTLYKNSNIENITSDEYKAIVVSGLDVLASSDSSGKNPPIPVVEARGKTPEEIHQIIQNKLK
ncbi:MAG: YkuS family protein [Tissierellia bacterium]|nr:YkuS family protein [Tissierellia bacterium]